MPLSLALFSDMVGISAMAIRSHWKIGLVWFPIPNFGIFQLNGAEIFDVENHKRKYLYIYKIVANFDLIPRTTARAFDLQG